MRVLRPPRAIRPATANSRGGAALVPSGGPGRRGRAWRSLPAVRWPGRQARTRSGSGRSRAVAGSAGRCPRRCGSGPRSGPGGGASLRSAVVLEPVFPAPALWPAAARRRHGRGRRARPGGGSPHVYFHVCPACSLSKSHWFVGRCARWRLQCPGLSARCEPLDAVLVDVIGEVAGQAAVVHAERGGGELGAEVVDELGDPCLAACRRRDACRDEPAGEVKAGWPGRRLS